MRQVCVKLSVLVLLALVCTRASGQFVYYGENPARLRWMQIETPSYKVIYPVGMDSLAKRYLWLFEQNRRAVMSGLGDI